MSKPAFVLASAAEVVAWRAQPMTKAFLEWIEWEAAKAKDAIAAHVMEGKDGSARVLGGRLSALDSIAKSFEVPAELPEVVDEDFRDPAERRRPRSQTHRAEVENDL